MPLSKLRPSFTLTEDRLRELQAVVPEAFADGRINWDTLREALGETLEDESQEHFGLFWPGKREARRLAAMPSKGTLIPQPGAGVDEENTHNLFIEGDNLEVLKLLQKSYAGQVGIIYIDPPYNTGNDFVYEDDFVEPLMAYLERTGQVSEDGMVLTTNSKASGRFHSKWLSMIYPRLLLARTFLKEDGVIFVSIGEDEVHNLKNLLCEVFGEENYAGTIVWQRSKKGDSKLVAQIHEYILVAVKNKEKAIESGVWRKPKDGAAEVLAYYNSLIKEKKNDHDKVNAEIRKWFNSLENDDPRKNHQHYCWSDDRGLYFAADFAGPDDGRKSRPRYDIIHPVTKKPVKKPSTGWRWEESRTKEALAANPPFVHFGKDETTIPCRKVYLKDVSSEPFASVFYRDGRSATLQVESLLGKGVMDFPKNTDVLSELFQIIPDKYSLVLDFFAGSCTTGHAIWELNKTDGGRRKFILVQLPERTDDDSRARSQGFKTMADIGRTRLKKASNEFRVKKNKQLDFSSQNLDSGFRCYKLVKSNYAIWENYVGKDPAQLQLNFSQTETPLDQGWQPENLLAEILLLQGFPLDSQVRSLPEFKANAVQQVTSEFVTHPLYVCLDKKIKAETVSKLKLGTEDIFVCLDSALSDEAKVKLADQCNLKVI